MQTAHLILLNVYLRFLSGLVSLVFLLILTSILSKTIKQELTGINILSSITVGTPGTVLLFLYFHLIRLIFFKEESVKTLR